MPTEHKLEQYSDDWHRLRLGLPTASQFHHIVTPKGAPTTGERRRKYMYRLIAERLLKQSMDDGFQDYWMKRGLALEEEAAQAFLKTVKAPKLRKLEKVGFFVADDGQAGASPDRIMRVRNRIEGVEIKCPSPWKQVEHLLAGPGDDYVPQVQGLMLVCGFQAVHLWCWHPCMPPVHRLYLRDEAFCDRLAQELFTFCNEVQIGYERAAGLGPYKLAELLRLSAEMADDAAGFARVG